MAAGVMEPQIRREDPDQTALRNMMKAADAYYAALYPAESNHLLDAATLRQDGIAFFVARVAGRARGFGALVRQADDWAEIKRMYVEPEARGMGLGALLLRSLERHAREDGMKVIRLETGVRQEAALGLYRAAGYLERDRYGSYAEDPDSVFLEKTL